MDLAQTQGPAGVIRLEIGRKIPDFEGVGGTGFLPLADFSVQGHIQAGRALQAAFAARRAAGDTTVPGFSQALQFGRANANANTAPISLTQVIETADSIRIQGHYLTFSFWATGGANFSGAGLSVGVQYGTGTDQSLANLK